MEHLLDVEKVGRLQALDTASSRDAFVAETLLKNEMEMEKKLADMRLMLQQEREQMLAQQAINMSMQQQEKEINNMMNNNNNMINSNSVSLNDLNGIGNTTNNSNTGNGGANMERIDLKEVRDQRREIEKLRNLLQNEKEQKNMLQKALESAENTIMDLTIQISTMNSNQFLLPLKSEESQKPRKTP